MNKSELFIKNSLSILKDHIIFCGSYALKTQGMITRTCGDYDIIMDESKFKLISFQGIEFIEGCYKSSSESNMYITEIHTCRFKDNSKIDFIIRSDFKDLKVNMCKGLFDNSKMLDPISIVKEKINLIEKNHNKEKHMHDIINIMQNLLPDSQKYTMEDFKNIGKTTTSGYM